VREKKLKARISASAKAREIETGLIGKCRSSNNYYRQVFLRQQRFQGRRISHQVRFRYINSPDEL
jgi:hypothetical protein